MNIFMLHENPQTNVEMHCDKHVVKMVIEYAQLMSTAHRVLDGKLYEDRTANNRRIKRWLHPNPNMENLLYKASHINHPCGIWLRESAGNYNYLYTLFACLSKEYTHRYGRVHLTWEKLGDLLKHIPDNIPAGEKTTMPQAMPDYCKTDNVVVAYRNYYKGEKMDFARWTNRQTPEFMIPELHAGYAS